MFFKANRFNNGGSPSIGGWNVSKVKNMTRMFYQARRFNQDINNWNVYNVEKFVDKFD